MENELIPLIQPAAEAAKSASNAINWSVIIAAATGAAIALIGVGGTSYVNHRIKQRELSRQAEVIARQEFQSSMQSYIQTVSEISKMFMETALSYRDAIHSASNYIESVLLERSGKAEYQGFTEFSFTDNSDNYYESIVSKLRPAMEEAISSKSRNTMNNLVGTDLTRTIFWTNIEHTKEFEQRLYALISKVQTHGLRSVAMGETIMKGIKSNTPLISNSILQNYINNANEDMLGLSESMRSLLSLTEELKSKLVKEAVTIK